VCLGVSLVPRRARCIHGGSFSMGFSCLVLGLWLLLIFLGSLFFFFDSSFDLWVVFILPYLPCFAFF